MLLGRQAPRVACFPAGIEMGAGAGSERGRRGFSLSPPPSPFAPATQLRLGVKLVHSTGLGARYSYTHVIHCYCVNQKRVVGS